MSYPAFSLVPYTSEKWVATTGHDTDNDGSSPSTPYRTIQRGIDQVAVGGAVKVKAGIYAESIVLPSGSPGSPIFLISIDGQAADGGTAGVDFASITGNPATPSNSTVLVSAVTDIIFCGFKVHGQDSYVIRVLQNGAVGPERILLTGNWALDAGGSGGGFKISKGDFYYVIRNKASGCLENYDFVEVYDAEVAYNESSGGVGTTSADINVKAGCRRVSVHHNYVVNSVDDSIKMGGLSGTNPWRAGAYDTYQALDCPCTYNHVVNPGADGIQTAGLVWSTNPADSIIAFNFIEQGNNPAIRVHYGTAIQPGAPGESGSIQQASVDIEVTENVFNGGKNIATTSSPTACSSNVHDNDTTGTVTGPIEPAGPSAINPFALTEAEEAEPVGTSIVAIKDFTVSGTGDVSVTTTDLAGLTPKGCIVVMGAHNTANDGGESVDAVISVGMFDGTNSGYGTTRSEDNVAATDTYRQQATGSVIRIISNAGASIALATAAFVTNGVTLSFSAYSLGYTSRGYVIFFAGADCECFVGAQALGTGMSAIDVTAPGFEPDIVFAHSIGDDNAAGITNHFFTSFGITVNDGSDTGAAISISELDNAAAGGAPDGVISTLYGFVVQATTATYSQVPISAFDASGFSATPSGSQGGDDLNYLAVKLGGNAFALVDINTPTSAGNVAYTTGIGFAPQFVLTVGSNHADRDNSNLADPTASGLAIGALTPTTECVHALRINVPSDPTDTANVTSNALALLCPTNAALLTGVAAEFVSMDASGFTLNYTQVEATAKMAFALVIEAPAAVGGYRGRVIGGGVGGHMIG